MIHGGSSPGGLRRGEGRHSKPGANVAAEYAADGIRLNVIAGGAIGTPAAGAPSADGWVDDIPAGRYGRPAEIAGAAVYLAAHESDYIPANKS
jgi:NAD(P)-dependent dehydrogenase (short-subunit alcohol dehydrogenase family)